jgi:hypothetical protein
MNQRRVYSGRERGCVIALLYAITHVVSALEMSESGAPPKLGLKDGLAVPDTHASGD